MSNRSILLIEDDQDIQANLRFYLEMEGFQIHSVYHGQEALDFFDSGKKVDMILLDLMMPVMSGYEFLDRFQTKDYESFSAIPIIIISATTDASKVAREKKILFLKKPIDLDELMLLLTQSK